MTRTWRALFGRVGEFNARIEENVGGMRVVQAFTNEDHERRLFAEENEQYRATKLQAYRIMTVSTTPTPVISRKEFRKACVWAEMASRTAERSSAPRRHRRRRRGKIGRCGRPPS